MRLRERRRVRPFDASRPKAPLDLHAQHACRDHETLQAPKDPSDTRHPKADRGGRTAPGEPVAFVVLKHDTPEDVAADVFLAAEMLGIDVAGSRAAWNQRATIRRLCNTTISAIYVPFPPAITDQVLASKHDST